MSNAGKKPPSIPSDSAGRPEDRAAATGSGTGSESLAQNPLGQPGRPRDAEAPGDSRTGSKSNRRDFLRGKSAAYALGDLVDQGLSPQDPEGADGDRGYLLHVSRQAMACQFQVYLNVGQYPQGTEAALSALDLLSDLEETLSYFRSTSRLNQINCQASEEPVPLDPPLFDLIELALRLHDETDGAFDITSAPLWEAWGFARRAGSVPSDQQIADAMQYVGSHLVQLDAQKQTVRFLKPGMRLSLGSIGKGYAVDRCGEQLQAAGLEHFLIHGGGSSVLARGSRGIAGPSVEAGAVGWDVGLPHPLRPDRRLGEFHLCNRALGTSGAQAQSFWHEGRRYGHILDPRTGRPAQQVFSVSVTAPRAALADALSTAFYVMQPDAVIDYCSTHPEIGVALLCPARRAGGMELKTANLAEDELLLWAN